MALISASTLVAADKYYKWVDKNGATHYSENLPLGIPATLVKVKAASPAGQVETPLATSTAATTIGNQENASVEELKQLTERQQMVQRSNCQKASRKLVALENAGRVRQLDKQSGDYRYLPNQEKITEISKMREYLRSNCRGK
jgi:hypothetical protein